MFIHNKGALLITLRVTLTPNSSHFFIAPHVFLWMKTALF